MAEETDPGTNKGPNDDGRIHRPPDRLSPRRTIRLHPIRTVGAGDTSESIRGFKRPTRDNEWEGIKRRRENMEKTQQAAILNMEGMSEAVERCAEKLSTVDEWKVTTGRLFQTTKEQEHGLEERHTRLHKTEANITAEITTVRTEIRGMTGRQDTIANSIKESEKEMDERIKAIPVENAAREEI